ncbi:hypothetical protein [Neisseria sp.]|uniref:hypothetical protein n=1 Tax=Neisseria sp. TaxID=192066 RepID=UPI0026DBAFA4|nr:hypothetical protein [Neisseria sp.]MDO4906960.1 hypothetical protein [Neisseria sp.]
MLHLKCECKQIVKQKIRNQAWLLDYSGHDIAAGRLNALAETVKSGDKTFNESQTATLYFLLLFGNKFTRTLGRDALQKHYSRLQKNLPQEGRIRCLE